MSCPSSNTIVPSTILFLSRSFTTVSKFMHMIYICSPNLKYGQWVEVESLIKELEQIEGVQNVTKGRFFLSPGLAPTFQVHRL